MKIIRNLTIITLLLTLCLTISACYTINSAKMSDVIGTYELTQYYTDYPTDQDHLDADCIAERGWVGYLIVTGQNRGWYVFKSTDTVPVAVEVSLYYEYDQEEPGNIAYITFKDSKSLKDEHLGVNFKRKDKILNHTKSAINDGLLKQSGRTIRYSKLNNSVNVDDAISLIGGATKYTYEQWSLSDATFFD